MKHNAYIILCEEPECATYVLPNSGDTDIEAVKLLLKHRAEEYVDEATEDAALLAEQNGEDIADDRVLLIDIAADGMTGRVYHEGNAQQFDLLNLTIHSVEVTIRPAMSTVRGTKPWYIEYSDGQKVYFDTQEEAVRSVPAGSLPWTLKRRENEE